MSLEPQKMDGKDLGDYVLIKRKLGSGSYADVYQGYRKSDNTTVAIKVVSKSKMNQKLNTYLELEIQTLKKIDHPSSAKHIYLIMEYCAGGTLSEYIRNVTKGNLPEKMVNLFMYEITKGLKYMSDQNLIHRDLKPQNILLTGLEDPHIKIADFGFARYLVDNDLAETQCGSPLYMAPEVLKGEKYNSKADLWSLAAILYEMFVGKPPFTALNVIQLIKIIKTTQIDYSKIPSDSAVDLMKKLFVLDPEERLSFDEFFVHPYIRTIFQEKEPRRKSVKISSPRLPKTSPFKVESPIYVSNEKIDDEFLIIDPQRLSLTELLKTSESGHVVYPSIIFDFSTTKYDVNNGEQMKTINQIENIALQAWSIAELALILDRSGSDKSEPFSLYIKSLYHLYDLVRYIKQTIPKELTCERITNLLHWATVCYSEFLNYANQISQQITSSNFEICPEELMYKYAVKLTKEAAFTEFLNSVDSNTLNMYKRCIYIFEYLNSNKQFEDEDKQWFKSVLIPLKAKIDNFTTEKQK